MNDQAQRIAIAEACGWKRCFQKDINGQFLHPYWFHPQKGGMIFKVLEWHIPDYLNDLNAMHEAEKTLTMGQLVKYGDLLNKMQLSPGNYGFVEQVINATARQRAEAFLRTIGKWENETLAIRHKWLKGQRDENKRNEHCY